MPSRRFWLPTLAFLVGAASAHAGTIVVRSGSPTGDWSGNNGVFGEYVTWTQAASYINVSIDAVLHSTDGFVATGNAYLTNAIGPGTTLADEIANSAISISNGAPSTISLFTGLSLGPGTYYLTIATPSNLGWLLSTSASTSAGAGVTSNNDGVNIAGLDAYPPASSFFTPSPAQATLFSVTGTEVSAVPEPSTFLPAGTMLAVLGALALRRRTSPVSSRS